MTHRAVPAGCTDHDEATWHILRAWPSDPGRLPEQTIEEWVGRMRESRRREGQATEMPPGEEITRMLAWADTRIAQLDARQPSVPPKKFRVRL